MGIPCLLGSVLCHHLCKRVCLIHTCHGNSSPNHLKVMAEKGHAWAKSQNYLIQATFAVEE